MLTSCLHVDRSILLVVQTTSKTVFRVTQKVTTDVEQLTLIQFEELMTKHTLATESHVRYS